MEWATTVGIELFAELAAQLHNPALRIFRKLLRRGAILHRIHFLARVIFEIAQQAFQLLLHLADFGLLLFASLCGQMRFLALQFLLARLQAQAFVIGFA